MLGLIHGGDFKIGLTTKQMYSICKIQFGVMSLEFGEGKQYAEGRRQRRLKMKALN
jgi:hypothetical protein